MLSVEPVCFFSWNQLFFSWTRTRSRTKIIQRTKIV